MGREPELAQLDAARRRSLQGGLSILLLAGEAGSGKTRLAQEHGARVGEVGDRVLRGRAVELQGAGPYQPLAEVVLDLLGLTPESPTLERRDRLSAFLLDHGLEGSVYGPPLGELLQLGGAAGPPDLAGLELRRHMLLESMCRMLAAAAQKSPLCVVLDDLHWAHDAVFHALDFLVNALVREPISLVLAHRTEEVARGRYGMAHPLCLRQRIWERVAWVKRMELSRLSLKAVETLCAAAGLEPGRAPVVLDQSQGLALFVTELIRARDPAGCRQLPRLEERSREIIRARLDSLSPDDRAVLQGAALIGESFSGGLLARVLGRAEAAVYHQLERVGLAHRLVHSLGQGQYRLTHARIRTALRDEMPAHLRRSLYRAAGEALEAESREEPRLLLEQAFFFREAGDLPRAARDAARAGLLLLHQQEHGEAWARAQDACELLGRCGPQADPVRVDVLRNAAQVAFAAFRTTRVPGPEVVAARCRAALKHVTDDVARADLWCWLAQTTDRRSQARRECLDAAERELAGRTDVVQAARIQLLRVTDDLWANVPCRQRAAAIYATCAPESVEYFRALLGLALDLSQLGRSAEQEQCLERAAEWAKAHGDLAARLQLHQMRARILGSTGDLPGEVAARERLLVLARRIHHADTVREELQCLLRLAVLLDDVPAVARCDDALREVASGDCRRLHFSLAAQLSYVSRLHGRTDVADAFGREALEVLEADAAAGALSWQTLSHLGCLERGRPKGERERLQTLCQRADWGAPDPRDDRPQVWPEPTELADGLWHSRPLAELDDGSGWRWEDPHGRCRREVRGRSARIAVNGILGFNQLTMPRLVQEVEGDFAVEVAVPGEDEVAGSQRDCLAARRDGRATDQRDFAAACGLLVLGEEGAAVRLSAHVEAAGEVLFQDRLATGLPIGGRGWVGGSRLVLRLERVGTEIRAYCRGDGDWLTLGSSKAPLGKVVRVGVCAEIPTLFYQLQEQGTACVEYCRLYVTKQAQAAIKRREHVMIEAIADAASREDTPRDEQARELLAAVGRSVDAEWGQYLARDGQGDWLARASWADASPTGGTADGAPTKPRCDVATEDPCVIAARVPEGGGHAFLFGRGARFEAAERSLVTQGCRVAERLLEATRLRGELRHRRVARIDVEPELPEFPGVVGRSAPMRALLEEAARLAHSGAPLLIQGESGTGKEVIARAIHAYGPRSGAAFVTQNCAALPDNLLESELFGHCKGAFTGAVADKPGLFEIASGGVIFLDEVADASPVVQAKLLRALEEGEIRRIGDTQARQVDVRIISASSRDLAAETREGRLRPDLFYRLNVTRVTVPPLRERTGDIPLLAASLLERVAERDDLETPGFTEGAVACLAAHDWPGNVRELLNEVERAVARATPGEAIDVRHLSSVLQPPSGGTPGDAPRPGTLQDRVAHVERAAIRETLAQTGGNLSRTARELGISRPGLRSKMERYGFGR